MGGLFWLVPHNTAPRQAGYDHILLDDCWGVRNNDTGKIEGDPTRFPEGMPAFIEKVHGLGFKFGLCVCKSVHACLSADR